MKDFFSARLIIFFLFTGSVFNCYGAIDKKNPSYLQECSSTKEYMTTYNFLKTHSEFKINPNEQRRISDIVSKNCSGASLRFIKITNLLTKAQLDTKNAMETAIKFIALEEQVTETFILIFKEAFLAERLDLDILTAQKMALSLSLEFDGSVKNAQTDFSSLVKFCVEEENLNLPKPICAQFAARITKLGANFKNPIGKSFIELVSFLTNNKSGPNRSTFEAMKLAESVVANGPMASENFSQAYKFAISKKGLELSDAQAIDFANEMASRTIKQDDLPATTEQKASN